MISKEEWDGLSPKEQWDFVQIVEKLLANSDRVVNQFECPDHGTGCVPYALEEIARLKALDVVEKNNTGQEQTSHHKLIG